VTASPYGQARFDRNSLSSELRDLTTWPTVDHTHLPEAEKATYLRRLAAISRYIEKPDISASIIARETGVDRKTLSRLVKRCIALHPDGRIFGFRALLQFVRVKTYVRIMHAPTGGQQSSRGGRSGAFTQLMERYPDLEAFLRKQAKQRVRASGRREVKPTARRIHQQFLVCCREQGIAADEYPFNQDLLGFRSMEKFLKKLISASFVDAVVDAGGDKAAAPWPREEEAVKVPILRPFEVVEFDGHRIDVRLTLVIDDPYGLETLVELSRIWILPIEDIGSRAILGYSLALGGGYGQDDVMEAVERALVPHRRRQLRIPGLRYSERGGFPSEVFPELAYATWEEFRFDNAKAHLTDRVLGTLSEVVGCWPDAGPPADPNQRPYIERFFEILAGHFAHHIPGTTGSNPDDIRRKLGDPSGDLRLLIRLHDLEEIIDVLLSNYNGEPHGGLGGRTPLEALQNHLNKNQGFVQALCLAQRENLYLLYDSRIVTVRGDVVEGVRPHVNFEGVRYSSEALSGNPGLIGKRLRLYYNRKDLRTVKVYFEDGQEFGILYAARPWSLTQHSLRLRKDILRMRRLRQLDYDDTENPVEVYLQHMRGQAKHGKRSADAYAKARKDTAPATSATSEEPPTEPIAHQEKQGNEAESKVASNATPVVKQLHIRKTIHF